MLKRMIRKELLQLRRDRKMFPILFVAPIVQLLILGYAANFDIKSIPVSVCDRDRTEESREYLGCIFGGGSFVRVLDVSSEADLDPVLDLGRAQMGLVIPAGFGEKIRRGEGTKVQILVNGSDTNYGLNGYAWAVQATAGYSAGILVERMAAAGVPAVPGVEFRPRVWYNPELKTSYFMVPALSGLILMIISIMLTAMAIVRERETGTIEMLVVTPIGKFPVLAGKLLPYLVVGLAEVALISLVGVFWFGVPFRGSVWLLALGSLLFLFNTLGLGLFVSTVSRTQQRAMMIVMFVIMMPFIYLSGFVFPIESMPAVFQAISRFIPLTYYLEIVRGLFLKGS
ncbi:MAG: ABC transporter permease, partial [Candidatus Aminicenantes bacterium]|nr:ABC transporter permease [Candidatus Aminicenantes bacterium]